VFHVKYIFKEIKQLKILISTQKFLQDTAQTETSHQHVKALYSCKMFVSESLTSGVKKKREMIMTILLLTRA